MYIIIKKHQASKEYVGSTNPAVHPDEEKAVAEAQRLAIANPGWEFIVCQGRSAFFNMPRIIQRNI